MQVRTVWAVYFSGTGTTEKIVTAIARHRRRAAPALL